jgi:hypothetical protein
MLGTAGSHRGHIQATNDRIAADNNGSLAVRFLPVHQHIRPDGAGRRQRPEISDTEEVLRSAVQTTMLTAGTRPGRWLAALPAIGGS